MRTIFCLPLILFSITVYCQSLEIEGKAKIDQMDQTMTADSVVVRLPDSTLGVLPIMNLPFLKFPPEGSYFFLDEDEDGFGLEKFPVWVPAGIGPPIMYVPQSGDCDDSSDLIHPGVVEDCCDGIDNDCDGVIDLDENCPPPQGNGAPCTSDCECASGNCNEISNMCEG